MAILKPDDYTDLLKVLSVVERGAGPGAASKSTLRLAVEDS
jgi:hypothetical protein